MIETRDEAVTWEVVPPRERRKDVFFLAFFILNLTVVTYQVDIEQIVIHDPKHFAYPIWPLPFVIDALHWYAKRYDPLLVARPVWYQALVWVDQLFYGPFYAAAIVAFWKGREWIRNWSFIWAGVMLMMVTIILGEEIAGPHATDYLWLVLLTNAGWVLGPIFLIMRMWREHPFTRELAKGAGR